MLKFFTRRWFLICLAAVLVVGTFFATPLEPLVEMRALRNGLVMAILFVMALPLQASVVWRVMRRPWAPLLATAVNFGLLPLFAWGVSKGLSPEMAAGLMVAAAAPATLASAAVWTRRAGGNDAAAIMVTIITNLSCFIVTPLWLAATTGKQATSESLELVPMITKLALLVVLPMALAQVVRLAPAVGMWATKNKTPLGVSAQCGVLSMVFLGAISTGLRLADAESSALLAFDLLGMVIAVLLVHLSMFAAGMGLARLCRLPREDRIAVGFAGSQKTIMVGLQVGLDLEITILPMVTYHVGQLFVDTLIADRLRQSADRVEQEKVSPAASSPPSKSA